MKQEAMQEIEKFQKNYLFDINFNTKGLVKLLGQVSYVYDNHDLIQSPQFQEILKSSKENLYQFQNIRELALLLNFCFKHQLGDENLWFAAYQHLLNTQSQIQVEDLLLILESINETNLEYLKPLFKQFENAILEEVQRNNHKVTIKALQIYRKFQPDNNNFFYSIKKQIIDSLPQTNTDSVLNYLRYYGLGNEPIEDRQEILNAIMIHLYKMQKFLNKKQLLQVYYTYVRTQLGSDILYRLIEDRVAILIDEFQLNEIEQLLIIAANQKNNIIFKYAERLLKQRLLDCNPADLVQIAVLFIENNQGTPEFIDSLEQHLIQAIYTSDDITELLWALVQKQYNSKWMEKIADACKERVPNLSVKQLTSIVWMTSDYFKRLKNKEKQQSKYIDLYELIEKHLIQYFEEGEVINRDVALVMNAYIRNIPISQDLVDLMEIYILNSTEEELQELDGWSVSQIIWGFSQIEQYQNLKEFLNFMIKVTIECIGEMKIDELFTVLRVYINEKQETEEMIKEAIEKTNFWMDQLDLNQVYLGIHIFTNTSFSNLQGINELIKKLLDRLEFLKSIKPQIDPNEDEEIDHDKEQKLRLEVEKYKYS
ncbi:unnamed protein product [Paramecium primaurelia]|uniref:Uncharacterized protein n=1 Tax=Paramecium primaurelia TaxID=5886 RepID=A0A8S1MWD8_PARPR|nr:unnamed protein product [Paramecium primaurelia]